MGLDPEACWLGGRRRRSKPEHDNKSAAALGARLLSLDKQHKRAMASLTAIESGSNRRKLLLAASNAAERARHPAGYRLPGAARAPPQPGMWHKRTRLHPKPRA